MCNDPLTNQRAPVHLTAIVIDVISFLAPPIYFVAKFKRTKRIGYQAFSVFPFTLDGTTMGFDVDRFLEPVDDDLKCGICFGVLEEPLATPCGHVFCAQCIIQWAAESGSCPLTCEQISVEDLKKILPLSSLIAKQNIRCENFRRGCPTILQVENIQSHLLKCHYVKANTSGGRIMERNANSPETREFARVVVCDNGCGLPLLYQDSSTHDCIKALQTQVASLQMKLTRAEQEKELACERIARREEANQDRVLNLENELHSYQVQVLNFERQLKEYRLQVGFFQKQADVRNDQAAEEIEVEVSLVRRDGGSLGFNIMGGTEVGSNSVGGGIVVSKVADGGPASKEDGLKIQDVILKVNGIDLTEASHATAVEVIKTASEPLNILVRRKCVDAIVDSVPCLTSTGTQTELFLSQDMENMDTDSGIHDRYSPRQDLLIPFEKSLDDGTSSSECSHRRIESFCREDVENLRSTSESLPSSENIVGSEQGTLPRVTLVMKDVNYVHDVDENSNCDLQSQSYVTAVSDEIYFDPEFDYEYEEITLWIANRDLGLTFCCAEEDESTVYVCEIEPGSVAYLDGRLTLCDTVLKINDVPVTNLNDIEPLVYESTSTIKFLVARPAQEVRATLIGSEGSQEWNFVDPIDAELSNFRIDVIKEEDEDGNDTLNSEKTNGDRCEKDSGVGRTDESTKNDESSEPELGEEAPQPADSRRNSQENGDKCFVKDDSSMRERMSSSREKEDRAFSPIRGGDNSSGKSRDNSTSVGKDSSRNSKERSPENSHSRRHNSGSPNKSCLSPTRNGGSPPRKEKDKEKGKERRRNRDSHKDNHLDESRGERDRSRHSDQKRNSKLGNVSRTIRASYIRAVNKDSTQHINLFGESDCFGRSDYHDHRSKKKSNLNENQSLNGSQQNIEWKVRMSKDGSQIFVRKRPVTPAREARNKLLRERAQKITDERKGMTTDDDTQTVYQGRYWPREDRRRHLERVREARRKKIQKLQQLKESESPHTGSGSESGKGRRDIIVEMSHRKMNRKQFDDFTTVREYLTQRNPDGSPVGPIHVTTV